MAASAIAGLRPSVPGLPVLLYHGIGTGDPKARDKYCLPVANFRAQLELLRSQHFCALPPQAIAEPLLANPLPCRPRCRYQLRRRTGERLSRRISLAGGERFAAAFFVNTAEIGHSGHLGWPEIREMQRAGMSFQSHGHHHVDYSRLDQRTAADELRLSREMLEQNLGERVDCFSAPYGLLRRRLIRAAHEAGFQFIFSSRNWPVRPGQASAGRLAIYQRHNARRVPRPGRVRDAAAGAAIVARGRAAHSQTDAAPRPPAVARSRGFAGKPMKAPRQLHIFVLIDALGWSLIKNSSFLREFLPHRQGLRTQLGFSSGVIPSILSGLTPAQNGIWNLGLLRSRALAVSLDAALELSSLRACWTTASDGGS